MKIFKSIVIAYTSCFFLLCVYLILKMFFPEILTKDKCKWILVFSYFVFPLLSTAINPIILFLFRSNFRHALQTLWPFRLKKFSGSFCKKRMQEVPVKTGRKSGTTNPGKKHKLNVIHSWNRAPKTLCVFDAFLIKWNREILGFENRVKAWVPVGKPLRTPPTYRVSSQGYDIDPAGNIGGGRCRNWRLSIAVNVILKLSIDVILSDIANVFQIWSIVAACYERIGVGFEPVWKKLYFEWIVMKFIAYK